MITNARRSLATLVRRSRRRDLVADQLLDQTRLIGFEMPRLELRAHPAVRQAEATSVADVRGLRDLDHMLQFVPKYLNHPVG